MPENYSESQKNPLKTSWCYVLYTVIFSNLQNGLSPPLSLFLFLTKCFTSFLSTLEIPYTCVT